ncbi:MAG: hypothetical protein QXI58_07450 [Candidatus Micrarchaeia archaeon]
MKIFPILVCKGREIKKEELQKRIKELRENILPEVEILKEKIANNENDILNLEKYISETDVILLYKPKLGLGNLVVKIVQFNLPVILFNEIGSPWTALDALEYVYSSKNVYVAIDYEDINLQVKLLGIKKKINNTRFLVLNADSPQWERWICRVLGGIKKIKEKFGIEIIPIKGDEIIEIWNSVDKNRIKKLANNWMRNAERIIEPTKGDIEKVARLYVVFKELLNKRNAQGLTLAYAENVWKGPLPVPCVAYMSLRDEGVPCACEGDIISLITMTILHYLVNKPSFMGNISVDVKNSILKISHCVAPSKMAGYDKKAHQYILRNQHWGPPPGVLSAFVKMNTNQEVTICRLDGKLENMIITTGRIMKCQDLKGHCRHTVSIKVKDARNFIRNTSGNHHVMIYGNYIKELKKLNRVLDIITIEI